MKTKVCTKCGTEKPLEEYYAAKSGKYGKYADCKACNIASRVAWQKANPEKGRAANARYRAKNKAKEQTRWAAYYQQNREWIILRNVQNNILRGGL